MSAGCGGKGGRQCQHGTAQARSAWHTAALPPVPAMCLPSLSSPLAPAAPPLTASTSSVCALGCASTEVLMDSRILWQSVATSRASGLDMPSMANLTLGSSRDTNSAASTGSSTSCGGVRGGGRAGGQAGRQG